MCLAQNILALRKEKHITQQQLADAIGVSAQAVSKWERNSCQPDVSILPLIAGYFHVSIDYLYYGKHIAYEDIYELNTARVSAYPQMSKESYEEAHKIFASAHHGISHGNLRGREWMNDTPAHISNYNGLSLLSGMGYGAVVTRKFFENINSQSIAFSAAFLEICSEKNCLLLLAAILSMSEISYLELKEKTRLDDADLDAALQKLTADKIVIKTSSKHKALGTTYTINELYHTCIGILLATLSMQYFSLEGITCCMGYGDYPIDLRS